ncbi:hypothetical protein BCR34DRAFT_594577 [Clohesyomyces aquaticus]|uniref:Uncharacterized protein n=1 Tax=Clohesyomyces aquaticus TaxID=1231657 RepID=A0A1Y1Y769_9PLEO|nr:hypothetical protein BCR34DRAFT_594577 [Clohesyomyces aquaticus]
MLRNLLLTVLLFSVLVHGGHAAPTSLPVRPAPAHITHATPDGQLTAWTVRCGYAISGMFCQTQRLTIYIVAICIFCFRFHEWLTAVGTAYIVTYTVTTAIYGFALAVDPALGSDADFVMVGKLLGISLFMTFLFARFAPHIFKINVAPALALWAGITLTAFVVVMIRDNTFYSHFYGRYVSDFSYLKRLNCCSTKKVPINYNSPPASAKGSLAVAASAWDREEIKGNFKQS